MIKVKGRNTLFLINVDFSFELSQILKLKLWLIQRMKIRFDAIIILVPHNFLLQEFMGINN